MSQDRWHTLIQGDVIYSIHRKAKKEPVSRVHRTVATFAGIHKGLIQTWEFKYNPKKTARLPLTFSKNYEVQSFNLINNKNYFDFLG